MNKELDDIRYQLSVKAREIARANHSRKSTQLERAAHYRDLVRDPEFLKFITELKTITIQANAPITKETPQLKTMPEPSQQLISKFEEINVEQYKPFQWTTYIQANEELDDILLIIEKSQAPNILIEADKGVGKTTLAYEIAMQIGAHIVGYPCSSGTREGDLKGRVASRNGLYQLGYIIVAIEIANETGKCILYLDELNALEPELQKMLNSVLDDRRCIPANGKMFKVNKGCKLIVIATMNPSTYAGTVPLNEDLRSRFVGQIWDYPKVAHLEKVLDWTDIPEDTIKKPLLQLAQDSFNLKVKGEVDYVLTTRDLADFNRIYRVFKEAGKTREQCLAKALSYTVYIKYGDKGEKELMSKSAQDTFPAKEIPKSRRK